MSVQSNNGCCMRCVRNLYRADLSDESNYESSVGSTEKVLHCECKYNLDVELQCFYNRNLDFEPWNEQEHLLWTTEYNLDLSNRVQPSRRRLELRRHVAPSNIQHTQCTRCGKHIHDPTGCKIPTGNKALPEYDPLAYLGRDTKSANTCGCRARQIQSKSPDKSNQNPYHHYANQPPLRSNILRCSCSLKQNSFSEICLTKVEKSTSALLNKFPVSQNSSLRYDHVATSSSAPAYSIDVKNRGTSVMFPKKTTKGTSAPKCSRTVKTKAITCFMGVAKSTSLPACSTSLKHVATSANNKRVKSTSLHWQKVDYESKSICCSKLAKCTSAPIYRMLVNSVTTAPLSFIKCAKSTSASCLKNRYWETKSVICYMKDAKSTSAPGLDNDFKNESISVITYKDGHNQPSISYLNTSTKSPSFWDESRNLCPSPQLPIPLTELKECQVNLNTTHSTHKAKPEEHIYNIYRNKSATRHIRSTNNMGQCVVCGKTMLSDLRCDTCKKSGRLQNCLLRQPSDKCDNNLNIEDIKKSYPTYNTICDHFVNGNDIVTNTQHKCSCRKREEKNCSTYKYEYIVDQKLKCSVCDKVTHGIRRNYRDPETSRCYTCHHETPGAKCTNCDDTVNMPKCTGHEFDHPKSHVCKNYHVHNSKYIPQRSDHRFYGKQRLISNGLSIDELSDEPTCSNCDVEEIHRCIIYSNNIIDGSKCIVCNRSSDKINRYTQYEDWRHEVYMQS